MIRLPYKKLKIWQKSMVLTQKVYVLTKSFPGDERFGLTQQVRRAVVSIPSNIAEGSQRGSPKEFLQFLAIAKGSLAEVETQILIARDLDFFDPRQQEELHLLIEELQKMLQAFQKALITNH